MIMLPPPQLETHHLNHCQYEKCLICTDMVIICSCCGFFVVQCCKTSNNPSTIPTTLFCNETRLLGTLILGAVPGEFPGEPPLKLPTYLYNRVPGTGKHCTCVCIHVHCTAFINPRRACAARVTVVCLCVRLSTTILAPRDTRRLMSDTNRFSATRAGKIMWRFR